MRRIIPARRAAREGLSRPELLGVVALTAVLAVLALAQAQRAGAEAREALVRGNLRSLRGALELFRESRGEYPDSLAQLAQGPQPIHMDASLLQDRPVRQGYAFSYQHFVPLAFSIHADPVRTGSRARHFLLIQSGELRAAQGRRAELGDGVIEMLEVEL